MPWNLERLGYLIVHGMETPADEMCDRCGLRGPDIGHSACRACMDLGGRHVVTWKGELE
jgi:hypothetical protein